MRFLCLFLSLFLLTTTANASIVINEILADPAPGLAGDANGDGVRSSSQDEFVELLNISSNAINISRWYITDNDRIRHIFPVTTQIAATQYFVVFGSTASTGSLSLNNSGDTVSLFDQNDILMNQITYGSEGGRDQSLVRSPEGAGAFAGHSAVSLAQEFYSPGRETNPSQTAIPEPLTMASLIMGWIMIKNVKFKI